jgi:hypothetical protein
VKRTLYLFAALTVVLLGASACNHQSPTEPITNSVTGKLFGNVTIGPNCPVEQPGNPCPTPPSAYAARKVLVYDAARAKLLFTVDIDSQGAYLIDLTPGNYVVDLKPNGLDRSSDVPKAITIHAKLVTKVDIKIDTGLR